MKTKTTIALVATLFLGALLFHAQNKNEKSGKVIGNEKTDVSVFYGLVIDQDSRPIVDAEIIVQLSKFVPNGSVPGSFVPDRLVENKFSVFSGDNGSFLIMISSPNCIVDIVSIKKSGYSWVTDWMWTAGDARYGLGDNRRFVLRNNCQKCPFYLPDSKRPAVFPMQSARSERPCTRPSRGGADESCDGKKSVNEYVDLAIPSAGPNAPVTPLEVNDRISQYLRNQ